MNRHENGMLDLYVTVLTSLRCILYPLCVVIGLTLGLQAGRDIGAMCNRHRAEGVKIDMPDMPMEGERR